MKLLLENWNKFLNEREEGEGILLYHATCFPPESFVGGIDPGRAKGFGQGEGFYFFTKKEDAIQQGKTLEDPEGFSGGWFDDKKEEPCPPEPQPPKAHIIISDEPVTPDMFDVDYEVYGRGFVRFVLDNEEFFESKKEDYGIAGIKSERYILIRVRGGSGKKALTPTSVLTSDQGRHLSYIAKKFSQDSPEMFKKFEEEFLSKASAIKYNGKEKLTPLRIEDLEGNVVWSRG